MYIVILELSVGQSKTTGVKYGRLKGFDAERDKKTLGFVTLDDWGMEADLAVEVLEELRQGGMFSPHLCECDMKVNTFRSKTGNDARVTVTKCKPVAKFFGGTVLIKEGFVSRAAYDAALAAQKVAQQREMDAAFGSANGSGSNVAAKESAA